MTSIERFSAWIRIVLGIAGAAFGFYVVFISVQIATYNEYASDLANAMRPGAGDAPPLLYGTPWLLMLIAGAGVTVASAMWIFLQLARIASAKQNEGSV